MDLPEELLIYLAQFLHVDDLVRFMLTNKSLYAELRPLAILRYDDDITKPILDLISEFNRRVVVYPLEYKKNALLYHEVLDTLRYNFHIFLKKEPHTANNLFFIKACAYYHELIFECSLTLDEWNHIESTRLWMKPYFKIKTTWKETFPRFWLDRLYRYLR